MIKNITKFFSSLRFTIWVISLLAFMFLLGLWIPQKSLVKQWYLQWKTTSPNLVGFLDALQLTEIHTSPLMLTLWVLFFINLALVMWQRLPLIRNRIAISDAKIVDPETAGGFSFHGSYELPAGMDGAAVVKSLASRGYTMLGGENGFYGVRNRLSPIAFGLFHISFFLILLGGLTSIYTEFIGYLELAEGESFQGEVQRYSQNPAPKMPIIGTPPQVAFSIKSIVPQASGFTETGLKVELVDDRGVVHILDINKPYVADSSNYVLKNLGMAPLFVLRDPAGREIEGAYFKLNVLKGQIDRFSLGGYEFRTTFYPDFVLENGNPATRSMEFKNPVFQIAVGRDGKKIAEGTIAKNGSFAFDGNRLELRELPFWVRFSVIKEHGIFIVYAGFFLACVAVVWRFLFFKREIVGAVREKEGRRRLVVAGRSEFYKSLAEDEFTTLFHNVCPQPGRSDI